MVEHARLIDGAGVVVQSACDGQVNGKVLLRHTEGRQILRHGRQLVEAGVKGLVAAAVGFEALEHLGIRAADGDEAENFVGILLRKADVLDEDDADLVRADLVKLVHRAHDIAGLFRQAEHGIEAVENFAVVHADAEALQAELREYLINNGRNFRLVDDGELAVADDVDIGLIEFAEAAALGALAAVDLANGIAPEREAELILMQSDVFCQRNGVVEAQCQIGVALLEAVNLLFRLTAALGQQDFGRLDDGRVDGREAVEGEVLPQDLQHTLELLLRRRQQLHKAGERAGFQFFHSRSSLY